MALMIFCMFFFLSCATLLGGDSGYAQLWMSLMLSRLYISGIITSFWKCGLGIYSDCVRPLSINKITYRHRHRTPEHTQAHIYLQTHSKHSKPISLNLLAWLPDASFALENKGLIAFLALLGHDIEILAVGVVSLALSGGLIQIMTQQALLAPSILISLQTGDILNDTLAQLGIVVTPYLTGSCSSIGTIGCVGERLVELGHACSSVIVHPSIVAHVALSSVGVVDLAGVADRTTKSLRVHMGPSLACQAIVSTPGTAEGVDSFQFPRHTGGSRDGIAGGAGEALPVDVCSLTDRVHCDTDASSVLDSPEHTLLAFTFLVECLAEVVLLSTHTAISDQSETVEAAGTLAGILGVMGSTGRIARNTGSDVEVAIVALQALCIAVIGQTMRLPKPGTIYFYASSLICPPDVSKLALLARLGLIIEHLAKRIDGLTDIIVVEVVTLLALQTGVLVLT